MWVIIGRSQCNFCDTAKAVLQSQSKPFTTYSVDTQSSKWLLTLLVKAGYTTVPQIFDPDGVHVGGYTELVKYLEEGTTNG